MNELQKLEEKLTELAFELIEANDEDRIELERQLEAIEHEINNIKNTGDINEA